MAAQAAFSAIGVCGGIASGKSTVGNILREQGFIVMDADKIGHALYTKGSPTLAKVVEAFGEGLLTDKGELSRPALRDAVFGEGKEGSLQTLNGIMWPAIQAALQDKIEAAKAATAGAQGVSGTPTIFVEAAVLVEAGWAPIFDAVWVVAADPALAQARAVARGLPPAKAAAIAAGQASHAERAAVASTTIANEGDIAALDAAVSAAVEGAGAVPLPAAAHAAALEAAGACADAGSKDEVVSHMNAEGEEVGGVRRWRMRVGNLWHRATYIMVRRSNGKLVVQHRTTTKDYCPGQWDVPTGGVVGVGEEWLPSAARELQEELGIPAAKAHLRWCFKFPYETGEARVWAGVLDCVWDGPLALQASEVSETKELTPDQIHRAASKGMVFTADGMFALKRYMEWEKRGAPASMSVMPGNVEQLQWKNRAANDVGGSALLAELTGREDARAEDGATPKAAVESKGEEAQGFPLDFATALGAAALLTVAVVGYRAWAGRSGK